MSESPEYLRMQIFYEIEGERGNQDKKWGQQDHPSLDRVLLDRPGSCNPERMAEHYEIPSENRGKFLCDNSFHWKQGTYAHILIEELCEVVACLDDEVAMREELVQLAAVAVAWIECIDRKKVTK